MYCPGGPHNTTQFISYEYNSKLAGCPVKNMAHSLMQDNIQLVPGEGIVMVLEDELSSQT